LILVGEKAPLHVPSSLEEIAQAVPAQFSHYHLIPQAGTPVYRDAGGEVERIVREFLIGLM
jgi:pimeloyl-ACP methyl ester carboxylesterase